MRAKLRKSFAELRKMGWIAKMNFTCCQSCGWAELEADHDHDRGDNAIFFHNQDNANIAEGYVYLAWAGDGDEAISVLEKNGLETEWDGSKSTRIKVSE